MTEVEKVDSMASETNRLVSELNEEASIKLKVIQSLLEPCDRQEYGHKLKDAASELGVSVRTVQRLFKRYQEEGLSALISQERRDKGRHRVSEDWVKFIVSTYQQGNKGSKRMNPKQVALKVEAKAFEMGHENPPSYRTILRVLDPILKKEKKSIRSPGWQGSTLSVKTRDGFDLDISYCYQSLAM